MGGQNEYDTKCFIKYLEHLGLREKSSKGSHHKYIKPGLKRPIIVRPSKKYTPELHISKNLQWVGKNKYDFIEWARENC